MSLDEFAASLTGAGLVAEEDMQAALASQEPGAAPPTADKLARILIVQGKLTKFQAQQAYAGKAAELVFGEYLLLDKLGEGGMGQVFKAHHRRMRRVVALKVLSKKGLADPDAAKRFQREVLAAAALAHPNIVTAYDAGEQRGLPYLVMEFVEGRDLAQIAAERGPLPVAEAVGYIEQAAHGLAYAHSKGIVHRDIKPANLLVSGEGRVKILDMGLARLDTDSAALSRVLTFSGQVMGTFDYMAPEQAEGSHQAEPRSDMYSLGCTLVALLSGKAPYAGDTVITRVMAHRDAPIPSLRAMRSDVPGALDAIATRMLGKRPEHRFADMQELLQALAHWREEALPAEFQPAAGSPPAAPAAAPKIASSGFDHTSLLTPEGLASPARPLPRARPLPESELAPAWSFAAASRAAAPPEESHPSLAAPAAPAWEAAPAAGERPFFHTTRIINLALLAVVGLALAFVGVLLVRQLLRPGTPPVIAANHAGSDQVGALAMPPLPPLQPPPDAGPSPPAAPAPPPPPVAAETSPPAPVEPPLSGDLALRFDGQSSYVFIPSLAANRGPMTLECWAKAEIVQTRTLIKCYGDPRLVSIFQGGETVGFHTTEAGLHEATQLNKTPEARWPAAVLMHVAGVVDGNELRLYLDGRQVAQTRRQFRFPEPAFTVSLIGASLENDGETPRVYFTGDIDEVRVSSIARYREDFTPAARFEPDADTLALYHCDEGSGEELRDASGKGHRGKCFNLRWVKRPAVNAMTMTP